jgi:CPA2 family monovalent cation:H+ antiporter-2
LPVRRTAKFYNLDAVLAVGVAILDTLDIRKMVEIARTLNPEIGVVLRAHSEEQAQLLREDGFGTVLLGENELATGMTNHILNHFGILGAH